MPFRHPFIVVETRLFGRANQTSGISIGFAVIRRWACTLHGWEEQQRRPLLRLFEATSTPSLSRVPQMSPGTQLGPASGLPLREIVITGGVSQSAHQRPRESRTAA